MSMLGMNHHSTCWSLDARQDPELFPTYVRKKPGPFTFLATWQSACELCTRRPLIISLHGRVFYTDECRCAPAEPDSSGTLTKYKILRCELRCNANLVVSLVSSPTHVEGVPRHGRSEI